MTPGTVVFHKNLKLTGVVSELRSTDPEATFVVFHDDDELLEVTTSQLVQLDRR